MLKVKGIREANRESGKPMEFVVLHLTNCQNGILAATFAVRDYVLVARLDDLVTGNGGKLKDDTGKRLSDDEIFAQAQDVIGSNIDIAYGFDVPISEILPGVDVIRFTNSATNEVAIRSIVGMSELRNVDEAKKEARQDAIMRERARLQFAISKGRIEIVKRSGEELNDEDGDEEE